MHTLLNLGHKGTVPWRLTSKRTSQWVSHLLFVKPSERLYCIRLQYQYYLPKPGAMTPIHHGDVIQHIPFSLPDHGTTDQGNAGAHFSTSINNVVGELRL
jgi:hypothetical protein